MKSNVILSGMMAALLLAGTADCHAEKWEKNDYKANGVETGFYDADSVKVRDTTVSWTEKYLFTKTGGEGVTASLAKYPGCRQNMEKKGAVTQSQVDYQIENDRYRGVGKRYYNKNGELLCTDRDLKKDEFSRSWQRIQRHSSMENAYHDLVTKYGVTLK